jgi:acyl-coenzyme A thioesterase PaaI-like protein
MSTTPSATTASAAHERKNRLNGLVSTINRYPDWVRVPVLSFVVGRTVPMVGTARIRFEKMTETEVVLSLRNRRSMRNHIGQIHAAAMTLLAETATGMLAGMNVPDDKMPLIKLFTVKFLRRTQGTMRAVAVLTDEQRELMRTTDKGETLVAVTITDATGEEVIACEMLWAWTLKRR